MEPLQPDKVFTSQGKELAADLVLKLYGLRDVKVTELAGYEDKNYRIQATDNNNEDYSWPHGYVLKVINPNDSKNEDLFDGQTKLAIYLGEHGIVCPQPVKNLSGQYHSIEEIGKKGTVPSRHLVRMQTYQPGVLFNSVPCTNEVCYKVGKFTALLDKTMIGFDHRIYDKTKSVWSLDAVPDLRKLLSAIEDEEKLKISNTVIDTFEREVLPKVGSLEKGLIHNDLNDQNIVMKETSDGSWDISAVIDLGDTHRSCYLYELSVHVAHLILLSADPLTTAGHIIAGYNTVRTIPDKEFNLLKLCISARIAFVLIMGAYYYKMDPGNVYLLTWERLGGWKVLNLMWDTPEQDLIKKWRNIISSY